MRRRSRVHLVLVMGIYIETGANLGKADYLIKNEGAVELPYGPPNWEQLQEEYPNKVPVCVVLNPGMGFEAAGVAYSKDEYYRFQPLEDARPKRWLVLDRDRAKELTGVDFDDQGI